MAFYNSYNFSFPPAFLPIWALLIEKPFLYLLTDGASPCNPAKICEAAQNPKNPQKNFNLLIPLLFTTQSAGKKLW